MIEYKPITRRKLVFNEGRRKEKNNNNNYGLIFSVTLFQLYNNHITVNCLLNSITHYLIVTIFLHASLKNILSNENILFF
jgi:hypothetical protein